MSACIAENDHYKYHMDTNTQMGVSWSGTLKAVPIGFQHIVLKKHNEHYLIGRPTTTVNNLILGTMYIEHVGTMSVKNCNNGLECPVEFKAAGWGNAGKHECNGKVIRNKKEELATMKGKWSESLTYRLKGDKTDKPLWKANPMPEKHDWQYFFTNFTMNLNNLPEAMKASLPRSDSRFRTD